MTDHDPLISEDENSRRGDVAAALDAALAAGTPHLLEEGKQYAVVVPPGGGLSTIDLDLDEYRDQPRRAKGDIHVYDEESFVGLIAGLVDSIADVRVYANPVGRQVIAVLEDSRAQAPSWRDNRVTLDLIETPAWKAWTGHDSKLMGQVEFAEFLQENAADIRTPDAATLLEVALSLQQTVGVTFEQGFRLEDGQRQFVYKEESTATAGRAGDLTVPERFTLSLNPWVGTTAPIEVIAQLRFRTDASGLRIGYKLIQVERLVQLAFDNILTTLRGKDLEVIQGRP